MSKKLNIDESLVRRMSKLLDETGLSEIEYEDNGTKIRVSKATIKAEQSPSIIPQPTITQEKSLLEENEYDLNSQGSVLSPMVSVPMDRLRWSSIILSFRMRIFRRSSNPVKRRSSGFIRMPIPLR